MVDESMVAEPKISLESNVQIQLSPEKSRKDLSLLNLKNHIIVGVFGNGTSSLTGLRNFVMPLRASNFTYEELKYIVFVGSVDYMQREWPFIHNFPKLAVLDGTVLSRADLRAANIHLCSMCAILSMDTRIEDNHCLEDAECILATLNIQSMQVKGQISHRDKRETNEARSSQQQSRRIPVITELSKMCL
ncbi:calcium-activated potassium channel subunit alpha-1-like [Pleurodeles waltl]|uniref:calcium-activated potassium channel subunit alpha-1-like n=1 Tax=Pleurodeles waltl TaxID=8319 RepID=UPI0037097CB7